MSTAAVETTEPDLPAFDRIEPLPLRPAPAEQGAYPIAQMGAEMSRAVQAIASEAFVPHSLAAQSVLAAASLAVQPHFNVQLPTGQIRPTSLFLVTVAESGDRKSTSDDMAMAAIRDYESELEDQFAVQRPQALLQQSAWDEAKRAATQREKNRGKDALEAAYRDLGPRPEGPIEPTIIIRTGTTQGLLKRFMTTRPSLGLMSDEGGSWLGGYGMTDDNRLATIATLSDFWDGKTVQTLTAGEGYTALRGRRLTFHLMIQPIVAGRLLGDAEAQGQGFLSRLLVSHPASLAGTRFVDPAKRNNPANRQDIADFTLRLSQIIRAPLPIEPEINVLTPNLLVMNEDAKKVWWDFYNEIEAGLGPDGELQSVKGFVGKLPEMAARLASVLAVFDGGSQIRELTPIMLFRGIELARFYLGEALRLFGQETSSREIADADELSGWLASKWGENLVSLTKISQCGPTSLRNRSDRIRKALEVLERHDHVVSMPNGGVVSGKKARSCWRVIVGRQA